MTPDNLIHKELDAETGLYYYGARYYTPEIGIWLSVDPLSDKYPHQSNYMYCSGRLVNVIDPDGRDEWDVCTQTGKMTWIRDSDKDVMFLTLNDKRTGNKSKEFDKGSFRAFESNEKSENGTPNFTDVRFKNNETGQEVFNFLADNTDVEWSRVMSEDKSSGFQSTRVHSSHGKDSESRGPSLMESDNFNKYNKLLEFEHSHPHNKFSPKDCPQCSSVADRSHKDQVKIAHPNAKFYIRHSGGFRREYTKDTDKNHGR
jgi:RHS repeat-associated protein